MKSADVDRFGEERGLRIVRAHLLLVGALIFMTSGADAVLPALLHLAQPPPCPHCAMQGCRCGAGCCDTKRCRRPMGTDHASMSYHEGAGDRDAAPSTNVGDLAINPRCTGADRDAVPPAGNGRPALIARSVSLSPPGGAEGRIEPPPARPTIVLHDPPTPPPRLTA